MRTYVCSCGNRLFFENTQCVACGKQVGWCPSCRTIAPLNPGSNATLICGNAECGAELSLCRNYAVEQVCNRCVAREATIASGADLPLCDSCELTTVIPDLSVSGNREKWYRLETAKRRLLYQLDLFGLPYGAGVEPPLSFDFKADAAGTGNWRALDDGRVYTGHADGKITINIAEADDVERERLRVQFGEEHRTLVGHFRHEIGHYYWQMLVPGRRDREFEDLFGHPEQPPYDQAMQRYYEAGPPPDWSTRYVSAYAAMHPWEDFAETFALYLEIASVLDTAMHFRMISHTDIKTGRIDDLISGYQRTGLVVNEFNRDLGLFDLVPRAFIPAVRGKLEFIHALLAAETHESADA